MFIKKRIPFPFIDIYLFKWNQLKPTGIHDHAEKGCYIWLLKGVLKEDIYNKHLRRIKSRVYKSPSISFMNNDIAPCYCHESNPEGDVKHHWGWLPFSRAPSLLCAS